jgi:hypothetical protein
VFLFFALLQFEAIMLRKASVQAVLRREVTRHHIPYSQCGPLRSYTEVLRHLHRVGADAAQPNQITVQRPVRLRRTLRWVNKHGIDCPAGHLAARPAQNGDVD